MEIWMVKEVLGCFFYEVKIVVKKSNYIYNKTQLDKLLDEKISFNPMSFVKFLFGI